MGRNLPIATQTRRHIQTLFLILTVLLHLTRQSRTWTNNTPVSLEDILTLRALYLNVENQTLPQFQLILLLIFRT